MGEKFAPDLHTGTGNFTVPIALPPGRNGFQPQLSLVYSTGNGNGPFGLGWNLGIPGVSRKTSKGIPRYDDSQDIFILSGAEDLVPVTGAPENAQRYRPRTEGLFARIDHFHATEPTKKNYWQVQSKDGLKSIYGLGGVAGNSPAVIADPEYPSKIFAWKLTETTDTFGNRIQYLYERDAVNTDGPHHWDQLYLAEIRYADYGNPEAPQFLVTVKFKYENERPDPFSEYRAGFEIRTVRRCTQIDVLTHEQPDTLTRSYLLHYLDQPRVPALRDPQTKKNDAHYPDKSGVPATQLPLNRASLLHQIEVVGVDGNTEESLPPLEFGYTPFELEKRDFFPITGPDLPPGSLSRPEYETADLFGDGLPDVFQMNGSVRYWRNLGGGKFDRPREMREAPAGIHLADPGVQLIDADGDGRIDLMVSGPDLAGYFPLRYDGLWDRKSFHKYRVAPSFNLEDPEVRLLDLDGDGVTDALRSGSQFECFFNDQHQGWKETSRKPRKDLEIFPNVNFSDPRVRFADLSGDGMQDITLIYDGRIEYWPNLGYGNWGKRITMHKCPRFPFGYDPRRVLVGDVDGDGLADIVYVEDTKVTLWINQSGNGWSAPIFIRGTPRVSDMDAVRITDVLGSGVSGILWSADAGAISRHSMWFLDFTGGKKPYVMNEMNNHMGAKTRVTYAPSTQFYLADAKDPKTRWLTPLPFPVQCVARVEVIDALSGGKLTTEYSYHHGYWDGAEREFRGFGRVDQRDTEIFGDFHAAGLHPKTAFNQVSEQMFAPPLETRTWFHQGAVGDEFGVWEELDCSHEYWPGDAQMFGRDASLDQLLKTLARRDRRDALRTLRGSILRSEVYALDGTEREDRPYTVTESQFSVREEDAPLDANSDRLRLFFPHAVAQRTTQWERGDDPMTQFSFTPDYDKFGQPLTQIKIACPRGWKAMDDSGPYLGTFSRTEYAEPVDDNVYIVNRVAMATTYEITKTSGMKVPEMRVIANLSLECIGHTRSYYDGAAFIGLDLHKVGQHGVLVRSESLVMTEAILKDAYCSGATQLTPPEMPPYLIPNAAPAWTDEYPQEFRDRLPELAGYEFHTGNGQPDSISGYFVTAERKRYDFQTVGGSARGLLLATLDPLGRETTIQYDTFDLLPVEVTDPAGMTMSAVYDYRVLQPREVTDPNLNRSAFAFSALGFVTKAAVMGKADKAEGDTLETPGTVFEYDFFAFQQKSDPVFVRSIKRIHHVNDSDVPLPERDETILGVEYSDGFGRLLQTRTQAEDVIFGDPVFGNGVVPATQGDPATKKVVVGQQNVDANNPNVVVSGWQTYDNKGRVIEKYEPFFAKGWDYQSRAEVEAQSPDKLFVNKVTMHYDPRGHAIRTVNPDGSEQRVIYGVPVNLTTPDDFTPTPWEAYTYDPNDLAPLSKDTSGVSLAGAAPESHHFTPASIEIDALGRTIKAVTRLSLNSADDLVTRSTYDIRGNLLTVTDALKRLAFQHVYDLANRPLRIESIDAGVRRTVMDALGNAIEGRDSKGALALHAYDEKLSRPLRLWARDGAGQVITLRERLVYADSADSGLSKQQAQDANQLGKLIRHYDEAGLATADLYDFKGNLLEKTRRVIADARILRAFNGAADNNWQVSAYRVNWQPSGATSLESHANQLLDAAVYETSSRYDGLNRVKLLRYPRDVENNRKELHPHYNRAGALERVLLDDAVYVERIAYNAKGQRSLIAYGNGVLTRYAYDEHNFRLKRLHTDHWQKSGELGYQPFGDALQDLAYEYDLVGNIETIRDRTPGCGIMNTLQGLNAFDRKFTYDALYRLRSATGRECDRPPNIPWDDAPRCTDLTKTRSYSEHYVYDLADNLRQLKHLANGSGFTRDFELIPDNNRLRTLTIGTTIFGYEYDVNGNMTRETTSRHFEWGYTDRMRVYRTQTDSSEPSVHAHYLYDAGGQRVKKLVRKQGGQVEVTVYIDGIFEYQRIVRSGVAAENNTLHVMDNQSRIALVRVGIPFINDSTPAVKYHLGDHLGSSNLVLDKTGNVVNREEYTPYGETSFGSFARKRYRFTGKERDEESGLNYHGARYYASWFGRWTSCDPAWMVDGTNLYQYSRSNPLNLIDLKGHQSTDNISDAGAPSQDAGGPDTKKDLKPGGVDKNDPYEYKADPNSIERQGHFDKGFKAGVVNPILDKIGPKPGIQYLKGKVASSVPIVGPRLADLLFNPLEKKIEPYYDKLKLDIPESPAGMDGYATGVLAESILEQLAVIVAGRVVGAMGSGGVGRGGGGNGGYASPLPLGERAWGAPIRGTAPGQELKLRGWMAAPVPPEIEPPVTVESARVIARSAEDPTPFHNFPEYGVFQGPRRFFPGKSYFEYTNEGEIVHEGKIYKGEFQLGVVPSGSQEILVHRHFAKNVSRKP